MITGISHITLIVQDLDKTSAMLKSLFNAEEVYSSGPVSFSLSPEKFFLVAGLWIALMEGPSIERSYNHIAFKIDESDVPLFEERLNALGLDVRKGRSRHPEEGHSLYFYDYDNHLFELHTGTLDARLAFYGTPS